MSGITPYRSLFDIDPLAPLFPVRGIVSDLVPEGFKLDIEDTDDAYVVKAQIAGVNKEDLDVKFEDGRLTISVDHKETEEEKDKNYIHKETREWSASRSVILRDTVREGVAAKFSDGCLTVTVPKAQPEEETDDSKVDIA